MNRRERYIHYVKTGKGGPLVSPQIGAGAGFDCKLAGKLWMTDGTLEDTLRACEMVECDPLFNLGLPQFVGMVPELSWKSESTPCGGGRKLVSSLDTPYGEFRLEQYEQKILGVTPTRYPVEMGDNLDAVAWYAEQYLKAIPYLPETLGSIVEKTRELGPLSIQWQLQPIELLGLVSPVDMVMFAMSEPEHHRKVCDVIRDVNMEFAPEVLKCGVDFLFLGGQGSEMMSPGLYERYIIPDSQAITEVIHSAGGLVYTHICSPIEPFLGMGFYNRMGIDLFETLSPPPVGNVSDLAAARRILDNTICTRGNVGLDVLVNGTIDDVERVTRKIMRDTAGYKHIVAASDYLFYDVPLENVQTMVRTVRQYGT